MSATPSPDPGKSSTRQLEQAGASDASITAIHQQLLREKSEPTEGFSPIPIFLLFVFSGLIFFGGVYIVRFAGEFSPFAFNPSQGLPKPAVATGAAAPVDLAKLGARLYNQQCIACHQATGQGLAGVYPPLAGSEWVMGNEQRLIRILLHGLSGPIEVAGKPFNGAMPAFGPQSGYRFNDQKIAAVLTHIRSTWGNTAPPVTPETVKAVMATVGNRPNVWSSAELDPFK